MGVEPDVTDTAADARPQGIPTDEPAPPAAEAAPRALPPGHDAHAPWQMPKRAWWQILKRVYAEIGRDNVSLISAGVAYYTFLSVVPLLASTVLLYGLFADPASIRDTVETLFQVMPPEAASIVSQQLQDMVATASGTKGWALALAIATSIYGAMRASNAIVMALNVAYEEKETRNFIKLNLIVLAFTVGFVFTGLLLITLSSAMVATQQALTGWPWWIVIGVRIGAWLLTGALLSVLVAVTFLYAPDRVRARFKWITPGSLLTTVGGLIVTAGFSAYVVNFGNYNATYGALGAVVVFLLWLYLLAYLLCIGAELNAELEKQTLVDTTIGDHKRRGKRGAAVADMAVPATPD